MRKQSALFMRFAAACLILFSTTCGHYQTSACLSNRVKNITVLRENGGRVDWSQTNDLIVYDSLGEDGYYDIHTMKPDGSADKCVICKKQGLILTKHTGNPAWHPSGTYIVFQAEKETHPGYSFRALPGFGQSSDLWLSSSEGYFIANLLEIPNTRNNAVLHPHFSRDGKLLSWSELYEAGNISQRNKVFGYWKLKIADFRLDNHEPMLSHIRQYEPGGPALYENHGFSPDGHKLLFSSNMGEGGLILPNNNIYTIDLATLTITQLTQEGYNEHAHYSPDGKKIIWMSNVENTGTSTDYWLMNADGSNKERLTYFSRPDCPEYIGGSVTAADYSWGPDGHRIVAYIQTNLITQRGKIVMITLKD